jgi:hypothetical protein
MSDKLQLVVTRQLKSLPLESAPALADMSPDFPIPDKLKHVAHSLTPA